MVSLHILDEPLLGPTFTHLRQPYRSVFLATNNPLPQPDAYLRALEQLVAEFNLLEGLQLVVNCSGWIKGMGYDLLVHFLNTLQPTDLVQMTCTDGARNLPTTLAKGLNKARVHLVPAVSDANPFKYMN
jgi:polynucleotide 5'-hydroxyl-kinase GRC3/NOL9